MAVLNLLVTMQGAATLTATLSTPKQGIDILPSVAQIIADLNLNGSTYIVQSGMTVAQQVTAIFGSFNHKALLYPEAQDLYTRRQICWNLLAGVWNVVDFVQAGVDEKGGQQTTHLKVLYDSYIDEIKRIEARAAATLPMKSGQMGALPPVPVRPGRVGATFPGGPMGPWRWPGGGW